VSGTTADRSGPVGRARGRGAAPGWGALLLVMAGWWMAPPYRIPTESMTRTLLPGDDVLVWRLDAGLPLPFGGRLPARRAPRRGELVAFHAPFDPGREYVKRCVAVAGDTLWIHDKRVYVNGTALAEPYAHFEDRAVRPAGYDYRDQYGPFVVPPGTLFVLGDNRDDSEDSRFFGVVRTDQVTGRPVVIYWSWDAHARRVRAGRLLQWVR
jgi:signal peptidase I